MSVAIIIQARQNSSRFPGKMLAPLGGKPMICHVVDRALDVDGATVIVASTIDKSDDPLCGYLFHYGDKIKVYRGNQRDVLARFYNARKELAQSAETVVRLTGDCPLIDTRSIENAISSARGSGCRHYRGVTNSPDGNDVESFGWVMLKDAYFNAGIHDQEHVTTWMRRQDDAESIESDPTYADVHYSVNTIEDLRMCELLLAECGEGARMQDYVAAYRRINAKS